MRQGYMEDGHKSTVKEIRKYLTPENFKPVILGKKKGGKLVVKEFVQHGFAVSFLVHSARHRKKRPWRAVATARPSAAMRGAATAAGGSPSRRAKLACDSCPLPRTPCSFFVLRAAPPATAPFAPVRPSRTASSPNTTSSSMPRALALAAALRRRPF